MDYKEILRGVLASAYKMADGEVSELLEKTDVAEVTNAILEKDKARISDLGKNKFQDGYKKAKGEALTEFEKSIREKYDVSDETLQGESLIETIVTNHVTEATKGENKKGSMTEDEIKKHPLYLKLEADKAKAIADNTKEWEAKLTEAQKGFEKANVFSTVKDKALSMLSGDNYVLPEDAEIAQNQKSWFLNDLKGFDYERTDDGNTYPIKDGKRIEDAHGHAITLDEFLKGKLSKSFPTKANNGGANAGNNNDAGANGGGSGSGAAGKPKNIDELSKIVNDKSIPLADRQKAMAEFEAAK